MKWHNQLENISKQGEWNDWIAFFLRAVISQAQFQSELIRRILSLYNEVRHTIAAATRSHFAMNIVDFIFSHPIFKQSTFIHLTQIPKSTTHRLLTVLTEEKILSPIREKTGRAGQVYRFDTLLNLLMNTH